MLVRGIVRVAGAGALDSMSRNAATRPELFPLRSTRLLLLSVVSGARRTGRSERDGVSVVAALLNVSVERAPADSRPEADDRTEAPFLSLRFPSRADSGTNIARLAVVSLEVRADLAT